MELDQAIASGNSDRVRAELGDVLLHLAFQIVLAEEQDQFGPEDVTSGIEKKMWRRHPHLYDLGDAPATWERSKLAEDPPEKRSILDGLPKTLPALVSAMRLQERAAGVGFDWPDADGPRAKVKEELDELDAELGDGQDKARVEAELGDILFAAVNLARKLDCDPRAALEKANERFVERFRIVEELAQDRGVDMGNADLEELDRLWDEAKGIA